jgi:putative nucleotidyltransferase with HDIG domain
MTDLEYIESCLLLPDPKEREARFRGDSRLRTVLPELFALDGVPQPPDHHPEGDVLAHTLLAVAHLPGNCDPRLAWAALLHDVGKALTTRLVEGRIRALGHDRKGVDVASAALERLGMEEALAADVLWLIGNHMFALSWQVATPDRLSRRQRRFIADPRFPMLLDLMEIDARASGGNPDKMAQVDFYRKERNRLERGGKG